MSTYPASPFRPTFGATPPVLVDRDELVAVFADALDDGPGSAARVSFYTGARGTGKTVLMNALEVPARERGWVVVADTCTKGLVRRLTEQHLPAVYAAIAESPAKRRLSGVSIGGVGGAQWDNIGQVAPDLRRWIERITDFLAERDSGLLISIDEIHPKHIGELEEVAVALQHAIREERQIAFVGAALSSSEAGLLSGDSTTFLRRAEWNNIGRITPREAVRAIREPIIASGRTISANAAAAAGEATRGYPFLVQLIGDLAWKNRPGGAAITVADVNAAIPKAQRRMGHSVIAPELRSLSGVDRSYLLAMAREGTPSRTARVAERMGVTPDYATQYRRRLLDAGVIAAAGHGLVDFVTPGMAEYILEHAAVGYPETD